MPVGPHRVRPGQQVIVTDPEMAGWLPIPSSDIIRPFEPSEVMLRFSLDGQIFFRAAGATATFGRGFASQGADGWRLGMGPVPLLQPMRGDHLACVPLEAFNRHQPFVLMVNRGGCTFLTKMVHATQAGAIGVLVVGSSPNPSEDLVLIRPAADGETDFMRKRVEMSGMVYMKRMVDDIIDRMIARSGEGVKVEVLRLEGDAGEDDAVPSERVGVGKAHPREGRMALGEWEIWNLKVKERPP